MVDYTCVKCRIRVVLINTDKADNLALCAVCRCIAFWVHGDAQKQLYLEMALVREGGYTYEDAIKVKTLIDDPHDKCRGTSDKNAVSAYQERLANEKASPHRTRKVTRGRHSPKKGGE